MNDKINNPGKVPCPYCEGKGFKNCRGESTKDILGVGTVKCWVCKGTGGIPKLTQVRDLLFEAYSSDLASLRQKCIWKFSILELQEAIVEQIKGFKDSIANEKEEKYIIDEYKVHLERFKEWSEYFMMEARALKYTYENI